MTTIHIHRKHNLSDTAVREHVQELAATLAEHLSARYQWRDDRLEFRRSGASGYVRQNPGEIEVHIDLSIMLSPLRGKIEDSINHYLDDALKSM